VNDNYFALVFPLALHLHNLSGCLMLSEHPVKIAKGFRRKVRVSLSHLLIGMAQNFLQFEKIAVAKKAWTS